MAEIWWLSLPRKIHFGGSMLGNKTFLFVYQSSPRLFSWNAGGIAVYHISLRFWISGVVPEIFAIEIESCQKSQRILDVLFALPNFRGPAFQCGSKFPLATSCQPWDPSNNSQSVHGTLHWHSQLRQSRWSQLRVVSNSERSAARLCSGSRFVSGPDGLAYETYHSQQHGRHNYLEG